MRSFPPEGISVRPLTRADAEAAAALLRAEQEAAWGRSRIGAPDVLDWWQRSDLEHDSWLFEEDGRAVAFGWIEPHGDFVAGGGCVSPDAHGRGFGTALVDLAERRAGRLGADRIHLFAFADFAPVQELLEPRGYREARRHWEMAIELAAPPPAPDLPEGLSIGTFRDEDARAWHAVTTETFAEEWGFAPLPFEEWRELRAKAGDFDPTLWFLVRDGGELAAIERCDANRRGGGWVAMLGVRKPWRRRGLGLALLRQAFGEFYRRGVRRVALGVDSENPTGATRLYERAGMHVESEYATFAKTLR